MLSTVLAIPQTTPCALSRLSMTCGWWLVGNTLRDPGARLRCPKCRHDFSSRGESKPQVPQKAKQTAEDKGMGWASVAAIISGIFFFNSCSQTTSGGLFGSAITERNWPAIIAGTVTCAVVAYMWARNLEEQGLPGQPDLRCTIGVVSQSEGVCRNMDYCDSPASCCQLLLPGAYPD